MAAELGIVDVVVSICIVTSFRRAEMAAMCFWGLWVLMHGRRDCEMDCATQPGWTIIYCSRVVVRLHLVDRSSSLVRYALDEGTLPIAASAVPIIPYLSLHP
jgi:hypothetical protein